MSRSRAISAFACPRPTSGSARGALRQPHRTTYRQRFMVVMSQTHVDLLRANLPVI